MVARGASSGGRRGRRRRLAAVAGSGTAALLAGVVGAATWYYAARITEPPGRRPVPPLPDDGVQVREVGADRVVLAGPAAARPGWWGLAAGEAWVRVGPPAGEVPLDAAEPGLTGVTVGVERPIEHAVGRLAPGATGRLDPEAIPDDPMDLGLPVADVRVPGPLGPLPAWWFAVPAAAARPATAGILVHGRSGSRREVARWAPTFLAAGVPALALSYRNAPGAPAAPDGRSHLGATEWEDVAAAITWVREEHGVRDVVLFGTSMGGACIAELLARSDLAAVVRAVALEAPVRHWGPVLQAAARERGLPPAVLPLLLPPTMALAGVRGRIDWAGLDHLDDPARYDLPTLLLHGDHDTVVPVALSDAFAAERGDVVTYHRVAGAGHVRVWNVDREGCEEALRRFLGAVLADDHLAPGLRDGRPRR